MSKRRKKDDEEYKPYIDKKKSKKKKYKKKNKKSKCKCCLKEMWIANIPKHEARMALKMETNEAKKKELATKLPKKITK